MSNAPHILTPLAITDAMILAGTTLPEDPTPAWTAGTYAVLDERHVLATHRVYRCAVAGSSTLSPELDPTRWQNMRPTNRSAPFDIYTSTAAKATTSMTYVVQPGYCNALWLGGLGAAQYSVIVRAGAGGPVIFTASGSNLSEVDNSYDYYFAPIDLNDRQLFTGIPLHPNAHFTIAISSGAGVPVSLGMIVFGFFKNLIDGSTWGGVVGGATADVVTYSRVDLDKDSGETTIYPGHSGINLRIGIVLQTAYADAALAQLRKAIDKPSLFVAVNQAGFRGLSTFGLGRGPVSYKSVAESSIELNVTGII